MTRYRMNLIVRLDRQGTLPESTKINVSADCQESARRDAIGKAIGAGWIVLAFENISTEAPT